MTYFKQFYLGCLAHASYLIGSAGEAVVIDPQRDVDEYLAEAAARGLAIRYVVETHLHADFVSGHCELAARAGAEIVISHRAGAGFPHRAVRHNDELRVGDLILRFWETPGHTPESMCVLVVDPAVSSEPQKVLTGDTLFIGDVGRPDLSGARGHTSQEMAALLYDSLHDKLLTLDDAVEVYPAHGAGSMCGRNISQETSSTIGQQRRSNYALAPMAKADFVRMMTTDLPAAPSYFSRDAEINRAGASPLEMMARPLALTAEELYKRIEAKTDAEGSLTLLDVRAAEAFGAGHVPGALNVGLGGQFASWAGSLLEPGQSLVLIADDEPQVDEAVRRLARVGLEIVAGYLNDGMDAWRRAGFALATVPQISVVELHGWLEDKRQLQIIDVRRPAEYALAHVPGAVSAPLAALLPKAIDQLDPARPTAVICAGGYRSSAATSLLARRGFTQLFNVTGGTAAYLNAGFAVVKSND